MDDENHAVSSGTNGRGTQKDSRAEVTGAMKIDSPYTLFLGDIKDVRLAKTASGIFHWKRDDCIAQYRLPGCCGDIGLPDMSMADARANGARTLVIGLATVGGGIPQNWKPAIIEALRCGLDVASGMHIHLCDDPDLVAIAKKYNCSLFDVRRSPTSLEVGTGQSRSGERLLTVGTDCGVGKMFAALAIEKEMTRRGMSAKFRATGQTGIFIAGSGICVDAVISDFISGAAEMLSPAAAAGHWDVIEGQGSLFHPSYAGVSLGLLHGSQPTALVLCHDAARKVMVGVDGYNVPSMEHCIQTNLSAARLVSQDADFVGICVNTSSLSTKTADRYLQDLGAQLNLPACDPVRTGVSVIVDRLIAK